MFGKDMKEKSTEVQADAAYNRTGTQGCCKNQQAG